MSIRPGATTSSPASCVLLADRHHALADGIRGLLATCFHSVVMVADEASLFASAERPRPTLVVVDLSLPRAQNLDWLIRLRAQCPETKLILLSVHSEPGVCRSALAAGADGYLLKRSLVTELLPAVDAVLNGERYVDHALASQAAAQLPLASPSKAGEKPEEAR